MGGWTPRIIQGGKTDDMPRLDPEADAFLQAFIQAGLDEQQYSHISFMNVEPQGQPTVSGEIPKVAFDIDVFGSPVIRFF